MRVRSKGYTVAILCHDDMKPEDAAIAWATELPEAELRRVLRDGATIFIESNTRSQQYFFELEVRPVLRTISPGGEL